MGSPKVSTRPELTKEAAAGMNCLFCGQVLAEQAVIERYKTNLAAHDRQLATRLREEARSELRAEYERKDAVRLAEFKAKAQEEVRKTYDRRLRQMEQSNEGLQRQLGAYKRRLEHLSSTARGALNEEDLTAILRREFPQDQVDRIKGGRARRADILHQVRYGGAAPASAGCIVYECKDTARWDNAFVTQAKAARESHHASHVVLVSAAFPGTQKAFAVIEDVVVVEAGYMVPIVRILRGSMVELARAGLSGEGRRAKSEALLRYIAGERFRTSFCTVTEAVEKVEDSLTKERRQHDLLWAERDGCYRRIEASVAEVQEEIAGIIEGAEDTSSLDQSAVLILPASSSVS